MSNHFIGTSRGLGEMSLGSYTVGTATTATLDVEVRVADLDQNGNNMKMKEVIIMLQGIITALESASIAKSFPQF